MFTDQFLAIIRCPVSKQPMIFFPKGEGNRDEADAIFVSVPAKLLYRVENRVPVLLADDAKALDDKAVDRLVARAKELGISVP